MVPARYFMYTLFNLYATIYGLFCFFFFAQKKAISNDLGVSSTQLFIYNSFS